MYGADPAGSFPIGGLRSPISGFNVLNPYIQDYRILVRNSAGAYIGEFDIFRNLKFGKRLNNYGSASFEIPVTDDKTSSLVSLRLYTIEIYRQNNGALNLVWAGEQAMREGNLHNDNDNWCTIYCYDWLEQLNSRFTVFEKVYTNTDAGLIAWDLINQSQSEDGWISPNPNDVYTTVSNGAIGGLTFIAYQSFKALSSSIKLLNVLTSRDNEPVVGSLQVRILNDNAGVPGTLVASSTKTYNVSPLDGYPSWVEFDYSGTAITLVVGNTYWVEMSFIPGGGNVGSLDFYHIDGNKYGEGMAYSNDSAISTELAVEGADWAFAIQFVGSVTHDLGITVGSVAATTNKDRTYHNDNIMESIINLANLADGFDFEITIGKVFNVYTTMGTDHSEDIILEYGRNISAARITEDFVHPCNRTIVLGNAIGETTLQRVEVDDLTSQYSYKMREQRYSQMDESELASFIGVGDASNQKNKVPLIKVDLTLVNGSNPSIIDFGLGDAITLVIQNGVYNINSNYRVFEWEVDFTDNNVEKLNLVLGDFTYV